MTPNRIDADAVQSDWAKRGYRTDLWIDPPDQVWHDFEYDVDHVTMLLEGTCLIELDGRTIRLVAGDELAIPAGTRHTVHNCGDGAARWLHGFRERAAAAPAAMRDQANSA